VPFDEVAWDRQIGDVVASASEAAQQREEFRLIVADIRDLAENQRTALLLRQVEGLSHIQIAEVMETTVPRSSACWCAPEAPWRRVSRPGP